ncbi:hypothetical protein D3C85_1152530 [compost metagenome]
MPPKPWKVPGARCRATLPRVLPPAPRPIPRWSKSRARFRSLLASKWTTALSTAWMMRCATCPVLPPAATVATPGPTGFVYVALNRPSSSMACPCPKACMPPPRSKPGTWTVSPCCVARRLPSTARPRPAACWTWSAAAPAKSRAMKSSCSTAATTIARSTSPAPARSTIRASSSTA